LSTSASALAWWIKIVEAETAVSKRVQRKSPARDRIFATAKDLFYRQGIRAVGVDTIVEVSGIAKTSLYRWFSTKDDLIVAFLRDENSEFWRHWDIVSARYAGRPEAELAAHMDWISSYVRGPRFRGCPFLNFTAEFPDADHPARKVCEANKSELRKRIAQLARAAQLNEPGQLADGLVLLIEGAFANSQVLGKTGPAQALVDTAKALIASAKRPSKGKKG
jgi:AcrR family transcriptional regulator